MRCLAFRPPLGDHLALCFYSGHLQVWQLDPTTGMLAAPSSSGEQQQQGGGGGGPKVLASRKDSDRWVQEAKYSFEGSLLALGSHDRAILLYQAGDASYRLLRKVVRHSSYITHIDFGANFSFSPGKEPPPHEYVIDTATGQLVHPVT